MLELSCTQERHIRHQERLMNKNTIAIAIAALLVGGVSVAAFQQARGPDTADAAIGPGGLDGQGLAQDDAALFDNSIPDGGRVRSEEHTSELQSLMRISYAVFCLNQKQNRPNSQHLAQQHL